MTTPLVTFMTKLGFDIDKASIRDLDKQLGQLERRIKSMSASFSAMGNSSTIRAAARLASAEARRVNAEARLQTQKMAVEKIRASNVLQEARNEGARLRNVGKSIVGGRVGGRTPIEQEGSALLTTGHFKQFLGLEAARQFTTQAFDTANFTLSRQPQFEFLTGSANEAQKQIAFVDKTVEDLGLNLMDANSQYRLLFAASNKKLGNNEIQDLFTSVSSLSTMLGTSTDAQNRAFRAFGQMISKGQVMSEELKGQLAESLPGAVGIFADALFGDGTRGSGDVKKLFKSMEDGKVGLEEISKVIKYMGTLTDKDLIARMLETPEKKLNKLRTRWTLFLEEVNRNGFLDIMVRSLEMIADAIVEVTKLVRPLGNAFREVFNYIKELTLGFTDLFNSMDLFTQFLIITVPLAIKFSDVLKRFLIIPFGISLAFLGLLYVLEGLMGVSNDFTKLTEDQDKGILGWLAAGIRLASELFAWIARIGGTAIGSLVVGYDLNKRYHEELANAKTPEERAAIKARYDALMKQNASQLTESVGNANSQFGSVYDRITGNSSLASIPTSKPPIAIPIPYNGPLSREASLQQSASGASGNMMAQDFNGDINVTINAGTNASPEDISTVLVDNLNKMFTNAGANYPAYNKVY